jgi:hypothetical protein
MRGVQHIIVEEDMDHPLIGRPVLDEMGFVASQHLDSVPDNFHLYNSIYIGEELLEISKQPSGALSKLLLKPADILLELIEDLPNVISVAKGKKAKLREKMKSRTHDEVKFERQQREEQSLFYGEIPDDAIDYDDVEVGRRSSEELTAAMEGLATSAEQAGMPRNGVQSLRKLVTEYGEYSGSRFAKILKRM